MQTKHSLAFGAAAVAAALTAGLFTVSARATSQNGFPSAGEAGSFLLCFYECKRNFDINVDDDDDDGKGNARPGDGYWKEVTLLVLANQRNESVLGELSLIDGNRGFLYANNTVEDMPIYSEALNLSAQDLDEINICKRLDRELRPQPVPEAGLIAVELSNTGVYGWVKNVLGEINRFAEDPFNSPVRDVAKTECRVVPQSFNP